MGYVQLLFFFFSSDYSLHSVLSSFLSCFCDWHMSVSNQQLNTWLAERSQREPNLGSWVRGEVSVCCVSVVKLWHDYTSVRVFFPPSGYYRDSWGKMYRTLLHDLRVGCKCCHLCYWLNFMLLAELLLIPPLKTAVWFVFKYLFSSSPPQSCDIQPRLTQKLMSALCRSLSSAIKMQRKWSEFCSRILK